MVKVCIKISQNWVINGTKANSSLKPNKIVHDNIWPFCPQNLGSTEGLSRSEGNTNACLYSKFTRKLELSSHPKLHIMFGTHKTMK